MRSLALFAFFTLLSPAVAQVPRFEMQEICKDLTIGYAVIAADINGDGKPDLVVVDKHRVVWFENPTWKMHTILTGKTKPDNVCVAALDVDGDGKIDLVLGADWAPFNTKSGGTLQWLKQPKNLDDEWEMFPICEEPTVHRVKVIPNLYGPKKPGIVLAPLMGRDATKEANWMDGRPVRILSFAIPTDPKKGPWKADVISEELHVAHNLDHSEINDRVVKTHVTTILTASYEGITSYKKTDYGNWVTEKFYEGNQSAPKANRGTSEIATGFQALGGKIGYMVDVAIEPWHGNQVVAYVLSTELGQVRKRYVIDENLKWGHAIKFLGHVGNVIRLNSSGSGSCEFVVGVRDNPSKDDNFKDKCGVRLYSAANPQCDKWTRTILDDGGIAVEDLIVADLDGDGKPEIIAVGRATHNMRIYWNKGK